jgi:hypothetical protein
MEEKKDQFYRWERDVTVSPRSAAEATSDSNNEPTRLVISDLPVVGVDFRNSRTVTPRRAQRSGPCSRNVA